MHFVDSPTRRKLPARPGAIACAIIHSTGNPDVEACLRYYRSDDGLQPHWMIGPDGAKYRIVDEGLVAYHAALKPEESELYRRGWSTWSTRTWDAPKDRSRDTGAEFPGYRGWRETWLAEAQSPLELVSGAKPNAVSIGIELVPPQKPTAAVFTPVQYEALAELLADRAPVHGFALDRQHVLGHQDVSPLRRCGRDGGWDPGRGFDWGRLWDLLRVGACLPA